MLQNDTKEPENILRFWFDEEKTIEQKLHLWFAGTPEIDTHIKEMFEPQVIAAANKAFSEWEEEPESCLALLLLLDQFSLNIYRRKKRGFDIVALGLPIALRAIAKGFDQKVKPIERVFYYLPLEHCEDLSIQKQCVALFERLVREAKPHEKKGMEIFLDYAIKHLEVIERFGRYPDRNPIMGRAHTAEEAEYMAQGGPPF